MAKYHISPKTDRPNICRAAKCPLTGENEHYPTKKEAQAAYEKKMSHKTFNTVKKHKTISEPLRQQLRDVKDKAFSLDDHGLDIANYYAIPLLEDLANNDQKSLQQHITELDTELDNELQEYAKTLGTESPVKEKIVPKFKRDPEQEEKLNKEIKEVHKITRMFDDAGLDELDRTSSSILHSHLQNDYKRAKSEIDDLVSRLEEMNSRTRWFRDNDAETVQNFLNNWKFG